MVAARLTDTGIDIAGEDNAAVAHKVLNVFIFEPGLEEHGRISYAQLLSAELEAEGLAIVAPSNPVLHFCQQLTVIAGEDIAVTFRQNNVKGVEQRNLAYSVFGLCAFYVRIVSDLLDSL